MIKHREITQNKNHKLGRAMAWKVSSIRHVLETSLVNAILELEENPIRFKYGGYASPTFARLFVTALSHLVLTTDPRAKRAAMASHSNQK